jgi:hypothetical protein
MSGMPGGEKNETEQLQAQITALRSDRDHWRRIAQKAGKGKERESPSNISGQGSTGGITISDRDYPNPLLTPLQ